MKRQTTMIDVGWQSTPVKHQPATYANAEVRGQLRQWKQKLGDNYAIYDKAYLDTGMRGVYLDFAKCGEKGRRRAFEKIRKAFGPGPVLESVSLDKHPIALWSILNPRDPVACDAPDESGRNQHCVTVNYILAGDIPDFDTNNRRHVPLSEGVWTLEIPDHALGRAIERSRMLPDTIIREAHTTLLSLPYKLVNPDFTTRFNLKAGPGFFVCHLAGGPDVKDESIITLHVRADTWVDNDLARDGQRILWEAGRPGERMMDMWLRPRPFVRITDAGGGAIKLEAVYRKGKPR